MKRFWKKGMAVLLASSMLFAGVGSLAGAEDATTEAPVETAAQEMPEMESQAAPETETKAPETESQAAPGEETEAPETQSQAAQETETESQTTQELQTESPETQSQTEESSKEEPKTEQVTEKETKAQKSQEEKGIFTVEEKEYAVSVTLPDGVELPEGAQLKAKVRKDTEESYETSYSLAEAACGYAFEKYLIYDLHFEKDGQEIRFPERTKEDIKVTLTFQSGEYKGLNLGSGKVKVYHIKDRTEEEIAQAREEALTEEEVQKQKAVELEVKKEEAKKGVSVSFWTDGFSDYVIGIPGEEKVQSQSETGAEQKTENVSETENAAAMETMSETEDAAGTETMSESEETSEAESETQGTDEPESETQGVEMAEEVGDIWQVNAEEALQITFRVQGTPTGEEHTIRITGDSSKAAENTPVVAVNGQNAAENAVYDIASNTLEIRVPSELESAQIAISGLPDGTYTLDAGGNYINNDGALVGEADYSSYCDTGVTHGDMPLQFTVPLTGTADGISVTDRYTVVQVSLTDSASGAAVSGGSFKLQRQQNGEWRDLAYNMEEAAGGRMSVKGLPFGTYRVVCETVPAVYAYAPVSVPVEVGLTEDGLTADAAFVTSQIAVRVRAVDTQGKRIQGAEFELEGYTLNDTENTLRGVLERGKQYRVKQTVTPYGYVKAKNVKVTLQDSAKVQVVQMVNKPTVVQIAALSKADGSHIAGVKFEVRDGSGSTVKGCSWTSTSSAEVLTAKLQPGEKYTLVQTAVPDGYYPAAAKTFTVSKNGDVDTVTITNEATQVSISRKGYDSRTRQSDGKYEYTNMRMLSGAVLEVQDAGGNTIEKWTSSGEPHVIVGKLAAGGTYTLVETSAPAGYEKGGSGEFTVKSQEKVDSTKNVMTSVTMQTKRANGKIQVVKRASLNGQAIKLTQTYYCALFLDEAKTQMYSGGVQALHMTSDAVYASASFENVPAGTYYVAETDGNGNVLDASGASLGYTISITNEKLNLSAGMSLIAEIVNDYKSEPGGGYTKVSSTELNDSYQQEYANYGGSAQAAAAMAAGDGTVATGDTTNILLYVGLLAAAVILLGIAVISRKKKK